MPLKPDDERGAPRPLVDAVADLGNHPGARILSALRDGDRRFNELAAEAEGLGEDELGAVLAELDSGGFVTRRVDPGPPLRVLYVLTPKGEDLAPALGTITQWANRRA